VAAAAASGAADVGPGILAAARALDLDFIPLLKERYDLVIPREHYTSDRLAPLLEIVRGADFRRDVEALGATIASIVMDAVCRRRRRASRAPWSCRGRPARPVP
jgi:molybdate-binding protein